MSGIINGAVQGHLIGTSRANAQNAADWSDAYNELVAKYNVLMGKFNAKNKEAYDLNQKNVSLTKTLAEVRAERDEYGEIITRLNNEKTEFNSIILSANADRTKSYDFIIELSKVVRKFAPNHEKLSNPNSILSEVNFYSVDRMQHSSKKIEDELLSGEITNFSKVNSKTQFDNEAEKKLIRAETYKQAAEKGIFEVDPSITPTF